MTHTFIDDEIGAQEDIAEFGTDAVITRAGETTGPAYAPIAGTPTPYNVKVLFSRFTAMDLANSNIPATDTKVLLSTEGDPADLNTDDLLTVGGQPYEIVDIRTIQPAGVPVKYILQCRSAGQAT